MSSRPYPTKHMIERCQQRGISQEVVEVLLKYGRRRHSGGGISYSMDKRARQKAQKHMGPVAYSRLAGQLDCYIVTSLEGSEVLTVAHRLKRRRR